MANSSKENSPRKSKSHEDDANANAGANDDVVPVSVTPTVPVSVPPTAPVRAFQLGEGSSSVPGVQERVEGFSSSSSTSSPGATPPRRVVEIALGGMKTGAGGGSGEGRAKRKRPLPSSGKKGDDKSQGAEKKPRKKAEMDAPKSDPICSLCGKRFGSWKAVFGHLRAHPERDWRGAFPPPKSVAGTWSPIKMSGPEDFQALQVQLLAPTLLDLARETLSKMRQETATAPAAGPSRAVNIDLNKEPGASSSPSPPPPPQGGDGRGGGGLDLNKPPPPESDDDNNGKE